MMKQSKEKKGCEEKVEIKGWKEMPEAGNILEPGNSRKHKTGGWRSDRPIIDDSKCIHCMMCVHFCPDAAIPAKDGKRQPVDLDFCKGCGICAQVCPVKCIKMKPEGDFQ
jgi:pyruvate ferredoxin oxidoreductase delta subunit